MVALGRWEHAREQPLFGCEELRSGESSGMAEVEDDAIVGVLGAGWGDRLGGDGADIVVVPCRPR